PVVDAVVVVPRSAVSDAGLHREMAVDVERAGDGQPVFDGLQRRVAPRLLPSVVAEVEPQGVASERAPVGDAPPAPGLGPAVPAQRAERPERPERTDPADPRPGPGLQRADVEADRRPPRPRPGPVRARPPAGRRPPAGSGRDLLGVAGRVAAAAV